MPKPQIWATDVLNEMLNMTNNVAQVNFNYVKHLFKNKTKIRQIT